jgi:hypothetical protein
MSLMGESSPSLSSFPSYLLPSIPFWRRKPTPPISRLAAREEEEEEEEEEEAGGNETREDKYLDGHLSYLRCGRCAADLCLSSQIISKGFTGRHGRAYLVSPTASTSAVSMTPTSSSNSSLPNTITQRPVPRQLVTGAHTVSDISCSSCESVLGWKYVAAEEESQRYKVGKFILETKRINVSSCWERIPGDPASRPSTEPVNSDAPDRNSTSEPVEFDSQDEDECEDLFAGVWSPDLASRRRRGRKFERTHGSG